VKTIIVVVSPKGDTKLETKGFAGAECQEASRQLEQALGIRQSERLTAEFHQGQETRHNNQQRT
jgi:hypothetical protein